MRSTVRLLLCLVTGMIPHVGFAAEQEVDPRVTRVLTDWQRRYERIKAVKYVVSGTHVFPKGSFDTLGSGVPTTPAGPECDITCRVKRSLLVHFPTDRHRLDTDEEQYERRSKRLYREVSSAAYNGSELWAIQPRELNINEVYDPPATHPEAGVYRGDMDQIAFDLIYLPFFVAHGILTSIDRNIVAP